MKARIRELLHAKPFRPFAIRMVDGREYRIENPEFVMASPKERTNVLLEESRNKMHYLPPSLIQSVEPTAELAA